MIVSVADFERKTKKNQPIRKKLQKFIYLKISVFFLAWFDYKINLYKPVDC